MHGYDGDHVEYNTVSVSLKHDPIVEAQTFLGISYYENVEYLCNIPARCKPLSI